MIEFTEDTGRRVVRFDYSSKRFYVYKSTYSREVNMVVPLIEDAKYKSRAMALGYKHQDMYRYIKQKPKTAETKPKAKAKAKAKKVSKSNEFFIKL